MMATRKEAYRRSRTLSFYLGCALLALSSGCSSCGKKAGDGAGGPLTPGKVLATPPARAGYVTDNGSDTLSVIDRNGAAVETVPVDIDPDAHEAPHHLAVDGRAGAVFVPLAFPPAPTKKKRDPHASHGSASDPGKLARLDLGTLAITQVREVDENPGDVLLTHDRRRVLVTHFDMKRAMDVAARGGGSPATMFAQLMVFDAKDLKEIGKRAVCVAPHGVVTTKDDKTAFVGCYGSDELAVVDLTREGLPTSRIPLGASQGVPGVPRYGPYAATLTPDDTRVVVDDLEGQDVRVYDRASQRFTIVVPLAAKAFMPAFLDDRKLLVPTQSPDGLALVDVDSGKVDKRLSFERGECQAPHVVRVAKDGRVYVVCEGDHKTPGSVLELDRESLAAKKKWVVGVYPDGLAFGDD
jgi:DNA-binding beta-propeller fold protein YncE